MSKRYFYGRVSTKDQNLARQLESARQYRDVDHVYTDKQSGKNFDRQGYQDLKAVLVAGDEVIVHSLDRLGRNKEMIKEELDWFKAHGVIVRILNVPTTLMEFPEGQEWLMDMVNNIMIEVLGAFAEQERETIRKRQAEGIAAMPVDEEGYRVSSRTGRRFGRSEMDVDLELLPEESVSAACKRLGISRNTYYRKKREMEVRI